MVQASLGGTSISYTSQYLDKQVQKWNKCKSGGLPREEYTACFHCLNNEVLNKLYENYINLSDTETLDNCQ